MDQLHYKSAMQLAALIRRKKIGCLELLDHFLARIEKYNPKLNAIIWIDKEKARKRARAADAALKKGKRFGPLHGVPMSIKESYQVAGSPTTWGAPSMKENVTDETAVSAQRMIDAGVTLFAKTNVPLMLADWQSYNAVYGVTRNPWDLDRTPGGSSGGSSAALSAGLTGIDAGSDIGSSIRNPAHYCGVFGHKPTYGLITYRGHALPNSVAPPDISVVGPLARSAEDLDVALDIMAGQRSRRRRLPQGRAAEMREENAQAIPCRREAHRSGERRRHRICGSVAGAGRQARQGRSQGEGSRARHRHRAAARSLHPHAARRDLGAHARIRHRGLEPGARARAERLSGAVRRRRDDDATAAGCSSTTSATRCG